MDRVKTENLMFEHILISEGQKFKAQIDNYESVLVILSGQCNVLIHKTSYELRRQNVFDENASALYIPCGVEFCIEGNVFSELALCMGKAEKGGDIVYINKCDISCRTVGEGAYGRTVCDIVGNDVEAQHIVVGETFNGPGKWSSFPPHKHDIDNPPYETKMEEIYFFKIDPPHGFGFQRLYSYKPLLDRAIVVKNNTVVLIDRGYHPVCVMPGCRLYYLWFLWGQERTLRPFEDLKFTDIDFKKDWMRST